LIEEDATEVFTVRENLVLQRKKSATRVDQVDARQAIASATSCARRCFFTVIG